MAPAKRSMFDAHWPCSPLFQTLAEAEVTRVPRIGTGEDFFFDFANWIFEPRETVELK